MLHITHRQTTAYHPESKGAVKRLHRSLKDVLCARTAAATWAEEIPWVLLGLGAQLREDTSLSPAEAVFGAPIVLPNEFLQGDEISVDTISKIWVRRGGMVPPLHPLYNGSYAVLPGGPRAFTFHVGSWEEIIAMRR
jgi:hypothetical protein